VAERVMVAGEMEVVVKVAKVMVGAEKGMVGRVKAVVVCLGRVALGVGCMCRRHVGSVIQVHNACCLINGVPHS
jgi:hypothetical protein